MKINQNAGFSLVEVMLVAALLGGLALGLAKLTKDQNKSAKTVESKLENTAIINEIRQILGSNDSCTATFLNQDATNTNAGVVSRIVQVTPGGPINKYQSDITGNGVSYGNGTVKIVSYSLSTVDTDPAIGIVPGTNQGATNLIVTFSYGAQDRTFQSAKTKKIRINVETVSDTDFRIVDCSSSGTTGGEFVEIVGDTMTGDLIMADGASIELQSDRSLKYDIKDVKSSLQQIRELRPVSFKWKSSDRHSYGFIAQEVQEQYPLIVKQDEEGLNRVDYMQLIPHLVRSVQELDQENAKLRKEIQELKKQQKKKD